ncbi:MetQ/NlpA family ABC transporter substrate-binding protein [uncultured Ilyobacter sp.]|uniref:MetQ/NlpA family ABC transporter substrate-binding protein n=1 Tax=uncultured Ilyobacter sp. TaxID=544433 RepID=UPI0029C6C83B|nr:MetQ/NlpA family ABC transporter substrate-binding protein [uncultured Ilyobacter sp.]
MKKIISLIAVSILFIVGLTSCGEKKTENISVEIKVGATPVPHAEILDIAKEELAEKGYTLEVVEFTDYVTPNLALSDGEIDANFFQHIPYLDEFAKERNLALVSAGGVHVEPMGLYSGEMKELAELEDGALIAIPNDPSNGARALILLQANGLIKLDPSAGLKATEYDIIENSRNFKFKALEAAQLPRVLKDVDAAVINGNYAIESGLNPVKDALLIEGAESPYVNIVAVKTGEENSEKITALMAALKSEKVKKFIEEKYQGGVVPIF